MKLLRRGEKKMDNIRRSTAFMTHNGLKVRLNHDFCAQYMDEENILAWYISIEAFDSLQCCFINHNCNCHNVYA